jgi:endoglucanase
MSARATRVCLLFSFLALAGALVAILIHLPTAGHTRAIDRRGCEPYATTGVRSERIATLSRGFNLTGWMDSEKPRRPDERVLAGLRDRGFTHIRLPVTPERLLAAFSSRDDVALRLAELDGAVDTLIALGFGVSIDLHPGDRLGRLHAAEPDRGFELIDALWRLLAQRHAGRSPERVFFEVLNEPTIPDALWNKQGPRLVETIRRQAPNHTIIYGPANYQQIAALIDLQPLDDPNVVYAVHFYEPMVFTHQGLDWSNDPVRYLHGVPFPASLTDPGIAGLIDGLVLRGRDEAAGLLKTQLRLPWTEDRIAGIVARAANWGERHRRPVIVNEFGVLGWKAAPADRARWIAAVRRAAEAHCMGWAHWDYADGFGFVRRVGSVEIPDDTIIDALLGGGTGAPRLRPNPRSQ